MVLHPPVELAPFFRHFMQQASRQPDYFLLGSQVGLEAGVGKGLLDGSLAGHS